MTQHGSRIAGAATALAAAAALAAPTLVSAEGKSWSQRATQMNRTEVSVEQARNMSDRGDEDRRNKIAMRRIAPAMPDVDWNTDPTAVPYMLYQVNKRTDLPVFVNNEGLDVAKPELFEHTLVYITAHRKWGFNEKEVENMQAFLKRGGTLLLDDCYPRGSPFADAVRPEVSKLLPGAEPLPLTEDDPLVKDAFRLAYPTPWPGQADFENRPWQYFLLDGRPAIFFTPNDDGCGWEISTPPSASNPIGEGIGHGGDNRQREVMYQWITNWFLYAMTH